VPTGVAPSVGPVAAPRPVIAPPTVKVEAAWALPAPGLAELADEPAHPVSSMLTAQITAAPEIPCMARSDIVAWVLILLPSPQSLSHRAGRTPTPPLRPTAGH
jgi:hypothetical protein